jgi:hypothetical protein
MSKLHIEGHDQWRMDEESGSIELVSKTEYEKYMLRIESEKRKKEQEKTLQNDVDVLKSEMSDIKSLLLTLVQNQKG